MSSEAEAAASGSSGDEDVGAGTLGGFLLALRTRGIRDSALLLAIERTPRFAFVPPACGPFVHHDMALPIACGQQATSPFTAAEAMLHLELAAHHRVLEIGTGSGWQAAVLSRLCRSVVTIERFQSLQREAEQRLRRLGVDNVLCVNEDGSLGYAAGAPYDRVIVNAAAPSLPQEIMRQLAPDAIVVAPLAGAGGQQLARYSQSDGVWTMIGPASFGGLRSGRAHAT